jgi:hypothetical protein
MVERRDRCPVGTRLEGPATHVEAVVVTEPIRPDRLGWVAGREIIHHHGPGAFAKPMSLPGEWLCTKDIFLPTNSSCAKSWVVL